MRAVSIAPAASERTTALKVLPDVLAERFDGTRLRVGNGRQLLLGSALAHVLPGPAAADAPARQDHPVVRDVIDGDHRELAALGERLLDPLHHRFGVVAAAGLDRRPEHHVDQILLAQRAHLRLRPSRRDAGADQ